MLQGLFNYDNPVWRFIGKLGDLIVLNILWTICSIPIFTIGASTTAVYYVTLKLVRDEDDSTIKAFLGPSSPILNRQRPYGCFCSLQDCFWALIFGLL